MAIWIGSLIASIIFFIIGEGFGTILGVIGIILFIVMTGVMVKLYIDIKRKKGSNSIRNKVSPLSSIKTAFPNQFIILDAETTGLSPSNCEITEIGAVLVDGSTLEIIDEFNALIDINGNVPPFITRLTGITKSLLNKEGRDISEVLNELSSFCGSREVYAHNSPFDRRFIRFYLNKHNISYKETMWNDTIKIFKNMLPGRKTYKLESLIQDLNVADSENHRALDDAKMTLDCLKRVI